MIRQLQIKHPKTSNWNLPFWEMVSVFHSTGPRWILPWLVQHVLIFFYSITPRFLLAFWVLSFRCAGPIEVRGAAVYSINLNFFHCRNVQRQASERALAIGLGVVIGLIIASLAALLVYRLVFRARRRSRDGPLTVAASSPYSRVDSRELVLKSDDMWSAIMGKTGDVTTRLLEALQPCCIRRIYIFTRVRFSFSTQQRRGLFIKQQERVHIHADDAGWIAVFFCGENGI